MIRFAQSDDDPNTGDCFATCIASILHINPNAIPNLWTYDAHPLGQYKQVTVGARKWLADNGIAMMYTTRELAEATTNFGVYGIAQVPSVQWEDGQHAIVVERREWHDGKYNVASDPNPTPKFRYNIRTKLEDIAPPKYLIFFLAITDPLRAVKLITENLHE